MPLDLSRQLLQASSPTPWATWMGSEACEDGGGSFSVCSYRFMKRLSSPAECAEYIEGGITMFLTVVAPILLPSSHDTAKWPQPDQRL
jgi:hypothetical protein